MAGEAKLIGDERTTEYLSASAREIGLTMIGHGWKAEEFQPVAHHHLGIGFDGAVVAEVRQLADGRWVAQYSVRTDIDDYDICRMYFTRQPSEKDIRTALAIDRAHNWILITERTTFRCTRCGRTLHWLDAPSETIEEKCERFRSQDCCI